MAGTRQHPLVNTTEPNYLEDTFNYDLPPLIKFENHPVIEVIDGRAVEFNFNDVQQRDLVVEELLDPAQGLGGKVRARGGAQFEVEGAVKQLHGATPDVLRSRRRRPRA